MKFVETYFKKHQFKRCPHKFTAAMLLSPIHVAECHYKKKYHMKFAHARKLFLFDMTLLMSVFVIGAAGLFWWTYDPTVTDLVYISITPSEKRILSGEFISFDIRYKNDSNIELHDVILEVILPEGFKHHEDDTTGHTHHTYPLPSLTPHAENGLTISGYMFATPHQDNYLIAKLHYRQAHRDKTELKTSPHITIARGSVLKTSVNIPEKIIPFQTFPITITLLNDGDTVIKNVALPLSQNNLQLSNISPEHGRIENNTWYIDMIEPGIQLTLTAQARLTLNNLLVYAFLLRPSITVDDITFEQEKIEQTVDIVHPHMSMHASWQNDITGIAPGGIATLDFTLQNDGEVALTGGNILLELPPTIVNISATQVATGATRNGNILSIPFDPLAVGEKATRSLPIHIAYTPSGTENLSLTLAPRVQATVANVVQGIYETTFTVPAIHIGTQVIHTSEIRYYTDEGDQLGRGPLPPEVGEETKYWAFFRIQNTTSRIEDVRFTATLPPYVSYTGRSSVSHGRDVSYNTANNTLNWDIQNILPHTTAGIYVELAIIPTAEQINTTPNLVLRTSMSAFDSHIRTDIYRNTPARDISLPTDTRAQARGVTIISP